MKTDFSEHFYLFNLVDCVWDKWVNGTCSKTCGNGVLVNTRVKLQEEMFGGAACEGEPTEETDCFIKQCPSKYNSY